MPDAVTPPAPTSITLGDIVTVLIRLLAIDFGLYSLNGLYMTFLRGYSFAGLRPDRTFLIDVFFFLISFLIVYWLWTLAGWVARRVTKGHNAALSATQLSLLDLYSFGFFLIGLYVAINNFGPALTWLHYAVTQSPGEARLNPQQQSNFYTLFNYLVKLIIGLGLVFNGRKLGTKLIQRDSMTPVATASPVS